MEPNVRVQAKSSPQQTCGFCRDVFVEEDERFDCPTCHMAFHRDCFDDELKGRCVTIGCDGYRPPLRQRISLIRRRRRTRRRRRLQRGEEDDRRRLRITVTLSVALAITMGLLLLAGVHFGAVMGIMMVAVCVLLVVGSEG